MLGLDQKPPPHGDGGWSRECGARDPPSCAWLASPWTDLTMSGATLATKDAIDPPVHKAYLEELADAYAPPAIAAIP